VLEREWVKSLVEKAVANEMNSLSTNKLGHLYHMVAQAEYLVGDYEKSIQAFDYSYELGKKIDVPLKKRICC